MRDIAKNRGMTLIELNKLAEGDRRIDDELDDRQIRLRNEDNFVLNSRLGFHFVPDSVKVYLDVDVEKAAQRILPLQREGESAKDLEEMKDEVEKRTKSETRRYKRYYDVDIHDKNHYDLVIDTTKISAEKVADKIVEFIKTSL